MAPRLYQPNRNLPSLRPVPPPAIPKGPLKPWEDGQYWHDAKDASRILTGRLGKGYSYTRLLRRLREGGFIEGFHWRKDGNLYKCNIWRFIEYPPG